MFNLVYFNVTKENINLCEYEEKTYKLNRNNYSEIQLMNSLSICDKKNWIEKFSVEFFADNSEKLSNLLFEIKDNDEKLFDRVKIFRWNKKYITKEISDKSSLIDSLSRIQIKNHVFLYIKNNEIIKLICSHDGETIHYFIKKQEVEKVESVIKKWAKKIDYNKFVFYGEEVLLDK